MDLTPLRLTPLGLVHTIVSVITIAAAVVAIVRDHQITLSASAAA